LTGIGVESIFQSRKDRSSIKNPSWGCLIGRMGKPVRLAKARDSCEAKRIIHQKTKKPIVLNRSIQIGQLKNCGFIQHLPEYPAACCGDEWLNIAFLRGAIPRQEGAGFI